MPKIKIKPLSVNECWQGRRFKTLAYKSYNKELLFSLPNYHIPKGKLSIKIEFGLSSKNADIDNPVKPLLDILQDTYRFNDKQIYKMLIEKVDVKKGKEYIKFIIRSL
jgi:Holliday junction resolvase RusA-like endonuclease